MKRKLFLIFGILPFAASSQQLVPKLKDYIPSVSCVFVAGMAEGAMDYLQFHYNGNNQFWQPLVSWKNKYKNNDPARGKTFKGKYLIALTDGWHLMKFSRNLFLSGALAFKIGERKKKWYVYVIEGASYWLINRIGFAATYYTLK